ncbi:MAG: four helix bundle protein [Anaerococcus sp.]
MAANNNEFLLLVKAKDLIEYTLEVTDNSKRFPKKCRFTFVNRMQNIVLDIYELINTANELNTNNKDTLIERLKLQNEAITKCKTMLFLIDLCLKKESIGIDHRRAEVWSKHVCNVKNMTINWHTKDRAKLK